MPTVISSAATTTRIVEEKLFAALATSPSSSPLQGHRGKRFCVTTVLPHRSHFVAISQKPANPHPSIGFLCRYWRRSLYQGEGVPAIS